jgi:hypothetical protein
MAKTVKVTVSMPVDDVERLKTLDAAGAIESVSGYVDQAVHDRLDHQPGLSAGGPGSGIRILRLAPGR